MAGVEHASTDKGSLLRRIVQLEHGALFLLLAMLCGLIYMFLCSFLQTYIGDRSALNRQSRGFFLRRTKVKPCCSPERDELRRNVEHLSTSQTASFGAVDIFSRIQGRRATSLEQELESCELKLIACRKENTKLGEELSEVYIIKSKFAELLKKEVEKSAVLEKEVKFFQSRAAAALSDRDRSIVEIEKYKRTEDGLMEKMTELQDRLEETTLECTEEQNMCADLKQDLEKTRAESEVYQKVVERFWKVREQATGFHNTVKILDRAVVLLQDSDDIWSYGETNKDLQAQVKQAQADLVMIKEEFQASSASVTCLQAQVEEENSARRQAENAVFCCKEQLSCLAELVNSECQQIQSAKLSLKEEIASFLEEEGNWLLSISKSWQHNLNTNGMSSAISESIVNNDEESVDMIIESHPQQEPKETSEHVVDMRSSCNEANTKLESAVNEEDQEAGLGDFKKSEDDQTKVGAEGGAQDVVIEALYNMEKDEEAVKKTHIRDGQMPLLDDNKEALAQALQDKVSALLLLSQQEERHILEKNTSSALESQTASLKQKLSQVTTEKVNALMELAQLHQECKKLQEQEKNFKEAPQPRRTFSLNGLRPIWVPGVTSKDENNMVQFASDNAKTPSLQGYLKHLWLRGPELGSRSMSLSHLFSLNRSKENEIVGIARLRVENATLRESLSSIHHLCSSANRLRLTIARVAADSSAQTERSIQAAVEAVDGVIAEALHLKVALHSSLPVNDLGWNSIGSPLAGAGDTAQDGSDGEANEDLDIVSFFGLEIVKLVLLAAQLQKRFLGQNV